MLPIIIINIMLFLPLHGEHGEVIALLSVAHEVGYSLRHPFDERLGLLGSHKAPACRVPPEVTMACRDDLRRSSHSFGFLL